MIGAVLDAIATVIPDRPMTVCGDRTSTFADTANRSRRRANFLAAASPKHRAELREYIPQITINNGYGSSGTGNMGFGRTLRLFGRLSQGFLFVEQVRTPGNGKADYRWARSEAAGRAVLPT